MENRSHALIAGTFTLFLGTCMVMIALWFGQDGTPQLPYDLVTRGSVTGLSPEAAVKYRGLNVGKVKSIRFDEHQSGQLIIRIQIDAQTPITPYTFATLGFQGVTGLAFVQLDDEPGHETGASRLPSTETAVARVPMKPDFLEALRKRGDDLLLRLDRVLAGAETAVSRSNQTQVLNTLKEISLAAQALREVSHAAQPSLKAGENALNAFHETNQTLQNLTKENGPLLQPWQQAGQAITTLSADTHQTLTVATQQLSQFGALAPEVQATLTELRHTSTSLRDLSDLLRAHPSALIWGKPKNWPPVTPSETQETESVSPTH
jgi:phospholipid/cholesterol/gamma-HCH transport system substrate-binding protein